MMNCPKRLRTKYFYTILLALAIAGCSKEEKVSQSVVQVNKSVLTEDDLKQALSDEKNHGKYREEYIQNWIETEVLYQKAIDEGILENKDYQAIIEQSKKQLAAAMILNKLISKSNIDPTNEELKNYYESEQNDFKLNHGVFTINIATFSIFDQAVKFRNIFLGSDWNIAVNSFRGDKSLLNETRNEIVDTDLLQPAVLLKVVSNLSPGEISLVIETEPSITRKTW